MNDRRHRETKLVEDCKEASSCRHELRQCHTLSAIFENNSHRHIDVNLVNRAADDIAAEARTFIEIDPGGDVGNVRSKAAQRLTDNFTYHGEGKYLAFAADFYPLKFVAGAVATNRPPCKNWYVKICQR